MIISPRIVELELCHTFTIARASSGDDVSRVVICELSNGDIDALGEVRPSAYYGESPESVVATLRRLSPWLEGRSPAAYRTLLEEAAEELGEERAALCALDLAVHDWAAKKLGVPLHALFGISPARLPETSFTIGIDSLEGMLEKLREVSEEGFTILKIKLGTPDDLDIVRALRKETSATIRVDANCAWEVQETIEKSRELAALGVEFIEQPLPADALDAMEEVCAKSALPVYADENSVTAADIPRLQGRFHGINIKLVKCGGLLPALRMIELARALGFKIMLGCMVESSISATAAAHIAPLVDAVDLDGPLLITNDPYTGVTYSGSRMRLPVEPGIGVVPR